MKQAADVLRLEKETAEKLAAKAFAKSYLTDLVPSVFNNLRENGYFYDPVHRDLETGFMPWIIEHSMNELNQLLVGRYALDALIRQVVQGRDNDFKNLEKLLGLKINTIAAASDTNESSALNNGAESRPDETSNQDDAE